MNPTGMIPNRFKRIKTSWKSKGTPPNATPPANKALYKALFGGTVVHNPWIKLYVLGGVTLGICVMQEDKIAEAGQSWYNATNFQFKESFSYGIILLQINKSAQGSAKLSGGQWGIKNFHYTWWIRLHIHYQTPLGDAMVRSPVEWWLWHGHRWVCEGTAWHFDQKHRLTMIWVFIDQHVFFCCRSAANLGELVPVVLRCDRSMSVNEASTKSLVHLIRLAALQCCNVENKNKRSYSNTVIHSIEHIHACPTPQD